MHKDPNAINSLVFFIFILHSYPLLTSTFSGIRNCCHYFNNRPTTEPLKETEKTSFVLPYHGAGQIIHSSDEQSPSLRGHTSWHYFFWAHPVPAVWADFHHCYRSVVKIGRTPSTSLSPIFAPPPGTRRRQNNGCNNTTPSFSGRQGISPALFPMSLSFYIFVF